jgi:hypothetical protein
MNGGAGQGHRRAAVELAWQTGASTLREAERAAQGELAGGGLASWLQREVAASWVACGAFEWVALGYLAASSALIILFADNLEHPMHLVGAQIVVAALIFVLCRVEARGCGRVSRLRYF